MSMPGRRGTAGCGRVLAAVGRRPGQLALVSELARGERSRGGESSFPLHMNFATGAKKCPFPPYGFTATVRALKRSQKEMSGNRNRDTDFGADFNASDRNQLNLLFQPLCY